MIKENLKKRAYLNTITSFIDYGARILANFIVTPFLLSGLGSVLFGVWQILGQFSSYTSMADLRITQVLKWAIAKDRGVESEDVLRGYVTSTFVLILISLPIVLVIGSIVSWYSPMITRAPTEYYNIIRLTASILIFSIIINKVFDTFESILRGMNIGYKRMGFRAFIFFLGAGLKILVIYLGYGLIALSLVQLFVVVFFGLTLYYIVKKHVHWFGLGKFNFQQSKLFLNKSGWFMGWAAVKMLLLNSDKVVLGYFAGPIIVTQYVISMYLVNSIKGIIQNVIQGVMPGMGKLYGLGDFVKLNKSRNIILSFTWILIFSIGGVLIVFNQSFVLVWLKDSSLYSGSIVNILFVIIMAQLVLIDIDKAMIDVTLDIKSTVIIGIISLLIYLVFSYFLIPEFGIIGLCITLLLSRSIMSIFYPIFINKKLDLKFKFDDGSIRLLLFTIFSWGCLYFFSLNILLHNWIELILYSTVLFSFLLCISIGLGLNNSMRMPLFNLIKNMKSKKS